MAAAAVAAAAAAAAVAMAMAMAIGAPEAGARRLSRRARAASGRAFPRGPQQSARAREWTWRIDTGGKRIDLHKLLLPAAACSAQRAPMTSWRRPNAGINARGRSLHGNLPAIFRRFSRAAGAAKPHSLSPLRGAFPYIEAPTELRPNVHGPYSRTRTGRERHHRAATRAVSHAVTHVSRPL